MSETRVKIYIAGDSTVQNCASNYRPQEGWGRMLSRYFKDHVYVYNYALGGRSTKSFIDEGFWRKYSALLSRAIHFLFSSGTMMKSWRVYADPFGTYQAYLKRYIDGAREKGALPVLLSPVNRRRFNLFGEFYPTHGAYPRAVKELCEELDVPFIDLTELSEEYYKKLGEEESKRLFLFLKPGESENYPDGSEDNTHFNETGAYEIAGLVVQGMKQINLPLIRHLK